MIWSFILSLIILPSHSTTMWIVRNGYLIVKVTSVLPQISLERLPRTPGRNRKYWRFPPQCRRSSVTRRITWATPHTKWNELPQPILHPASYLIPLSSQSQHSAFYIYNFPKPQSDTLSYDFHSWDTNSYLPLLQSFLNTRKAPHPTCLPTPHLHPYPRSTLPSKVYHQALLRTREPSDVRARVFLGFLTSMT